MYRFLIVTGGSRGGFQHVAPDCDDVVVVVVQDDDDDLLVHSPVDR